MSATKLAVFGATVVAILCGLFGCGSVEGDGTVSPAPEATPEPPPTAVNSSGILAGPLNFTALDGRQISLEALRGKAVLVFIFSTTCPHCQDAAEALGPIYTDWKDRGVEILGLAMNQEAVKTLGGFATAHNVAFPVGILDRHSVLRFVGASTLPKFYYPYLSFVDRQGKVRETHEGSERAFFANFDANVRLLLGEL